MVLMNSMIDQRSLKINNKLRKNYEKIKQFVCLILVATSYRTHATPPYLACLWNDFPNVQHKCGRNHVEGATTHTQSSNKLESLSILPTMVDFAQLLE